MAITLYASATDVREAYEGTIPDDTKNNDRLDGLLRRASAKLARLVPSLDRRMADGVVDPEVPAGLVVEAVLRVWRNPSGLTQQGVGPFQASYSSDAATNEIKFPEDDIRLLQNENAAPSSFRVDYPGRQRLLDGFVDAERPLHVVIHPSGL